MKNLIIYVCYPKILLFVFISKLLTYQLGHRNIYVRSRTYIDEEYSHVWWK